MPTCSATKYCLPRKLVGLDRHARLHHLVALLDIRTRSDPAKRLQCYRASMPNRNARSSRCELFALMCTYYYNFKYVIGLTFIGPSPSHRDVIGYGSECSVQPRFWRRHTYL